VGTWGAIRTKHVRPGVFRSRTRIRDKDGVTREVTATGTTKPAAERALMAKLVDRSAPTKHVVTSDTTIAKLSDLWLAFLRAEGRIENTTINEYERVLTGVVLPELGGLRLREATTSRLDLFLVGVRARSVNQQRKAKVVLGAMIDMAVRHDALPVNPVRQTSRVRRTKTGTRSLTIDDIATVRAAVRNWITKGRPGPKASSDMADIIDLMLATGARIGEVLALRWSDVDLDATRPNVTINGTI
jgi:integrase